MSSNPTQADSEEKHNTLLAQPAGRGNKAEVAADRQRKAQASRNKLVLARQRQTQQACGSRYPRPASQADRRTERREQ